MQDAWRAYLELALGLTEASRKRAQTVATKLVGQSGATAGQLQTMAEELISTGVANREALTKIVRAEIDRTLGVLGLATAEEVAALTERVRRVERELAAIRATAPRPGTGTSTAAGLPTENGSPAGAAAGKNVPKVGKKAVAKKAVGKKAVGKKAVAKKEGATKVVATRKSTPAKALLRQSPATGGAA